MQNWKTTLGGLMLAFGTAGIGVEAVPANYKWVFAVLSATGGILLGLTAKDYDTHSTTTEVQKATEEKKS